MNRYAKHGALLMRLLVVVCLLEILPLHAQSNPSSDLTIPAELMPSDPEIRTLLGVPNSSCNSESPDARIEKLQKAVDIAEKKGLVGDRAVLEASVASVFIGQGKLDEGSLLFQKGLQDSIDAGRQVLQADILTSVASLAQVKGDTEQAIELVNKALSLSEQAGNLYGKARALGELGRLKLVSGKTDEASALINEALNIDRLNGYKFEALHLYYLGVYFGVIGKRDEAMQSVMEARGKAAAAKDVFTFVSAENAYALGLVQKGNADEALREMNLLESGNLNEFVKDSNDRACLSSSLQLPLTRLVWLEGFANVLDAAHQTEKEIETWQQVFSISESVGLFQGEAEAKQKAADLENRLKKTEEAVTDYRDAAELYEKLQNKFALNQVEIPEALLLVQLGRSKEAVPIVEEITAYAKERNLRGLQFSSYLELGEIYQPGGDVNDARAALEKAEALVHPGPFDAEIDDHQVHEVYVRLSDIYRALGLPTEELISIDKAFFVSAHLHDDKSQQAELNYLNQRLNDLGVRKLAGQSQQSGQLTDSLIYSYILYIHDGFPTKPTDDQSNWQRILSLPFQIVQQPQGNEILQNILADVGPMVGFEKLPLLNALARYYVGRGSDPSLAEKYAEEAETLVDDLKGDNSALRTEPTCILAVAHARQNKNSLAEQESDECLRLAATAKDEQTITYADVVKALVDAQTGDFASSRSSLENLLAKTPDNPALQTELAVSFASAKLYNQASSELQAATTKLVSAGDKRGAAEAFTHVAAALNSDSSDRAKALQLQYLNSAAQEYRECGAGAEEAETLILIGDYYSGHSQTKLAIESYRRAQDIAEKVGEANTLAQALLGQGNAYEAQKNFSRASELHRKAADAFHKLNNNFGETLALRNLALDYGGLDDMDSALSAALDAWKTADNAGELNKYFAAYALGEVYTTKGDFESGLKSYREAADITALADDSEHCAYSHLAIAQVDTVIGNWDEALSETQTAMELFQKIGNKEGQGDSWAELMGIYEDRSSSLKDFEKAQECYRKAQELGIGKTLQVELIELYVQTGRSSEAANIAREALKDCRKERNTDCTAENLISLSEAERLGGDLKASASALNEASPRASKSADTYLKGQLLYARANLLKAENRPEEARASYEQLISLIENVKGKLDPHSQNSISENYGYIYDEFVSLLYSLSKQTPSRRFELSSEALAYAEKNKARQFAQSWGRVFESQMRLTLPPDVQEREQQLYSERDRLTGQLEAASQSDHSDQNADEIARLQTQLSANQSQIRGFLGDLRKIAPQYAAVAYPEDVQISSLPLKSDETLIEFKMTESSTFVWMIQNPDGRGNQVAMFYEIPKTRAWFNDHLSSIRDALNSAQPGAIDWKASDELFSTLFPGDAARIVANSEQIVFVPDDVLFVLPFELLSPTASRGDFILLRKPTTYYPSAVAFRLARTVVHPSGWQETFLGIGDPITSPEDERFQVAKVLQSSNRFEEGRVGPTIQPKPGPNPGLLKSRGFSFERLPGTGLEVKSIAALIAEQKETTDVRLGASATKQALLDTDLSKFRFIHFATHGILPTDSAIQEPSLVLSYDGVAVADMFLSISEILHLKLQAESVVLSACNTGSGKISKAEGVMSLGRAFLAAGSASVTVSLWQVSDDSTALLMEDYYKELLQHKSKSVALADARYAVFVSGSKNPFYWAPFIVIGE